jgi:hypothetical protein
MEKKSNKPCLLRRAKRDEKILKLFAKWEPIYGRTAAYHKIADKGLADYTTIIKVVKNSEKVEENTDL